MTGVNEVRQKFNLTGKGIKVAIVDSGAFYTHQALGGCFGEGCRVAFGFDLVGDTYGLQNGTAVDDADPFDNCSGESHGTHVMGIVGGDARLITDPQWKPDVPFTGVAPESTLGAYRVFGCSEDGTGTDIITQVRRPPP
ncbi:peptidase S8/S53 domain-containing protein [Chytridium lagenaria]|nr:peptidase S8/S53 domain-containing protein [Chytridium lagenaria]